MPSEHGWNKHLDYDFTDPVHQVMGNRTSSSNCRLYVGRDFLQVSKKNIDFEDINIEKNEERIFSHQVPQVHFGPCSLVMSDKLTCMLT